MPDQSWLKKGTGFPSGGTTIDVEYRKGNGSSRLHLATIGPLIASALGCLQLFPGSLNLWAADAIEFPDPAKAHCGNADWLFVPVIINEAEVGIAARRPPPTDGPFIEVFACTQLAPKLGVSYGSRVTIRMLSGSYLGPAA